MKSVERWEVEDHGVEHSQYFQGAGLAFTTFESIGTGIGDSPGEALDDAIEQLAMEDWKFPDSLLAELRADLGTEEEINRDFVAESIEAELPEEKWTVQRHSYSGLAYEMQSFEDKDSARDYVASLLRNRRRDFDMRVSVIARGSHWECLDPDDAVLVSDFAGTVGLNGNQSERDSAREDMFENSELHYFVSVRVSSAKDEDA